MSQDASQALKEQGNNRFKGGRFADAATFYRRAEKASPEDPVYPSNLSAALYELGDYASCLRAICRATEKCTSPNDPLLSRLSMRLAKALSYEIRRGRIPANLLDEASDTIKKLSSIGESSAATKDLGNAWQDWRRVEGEIKRVSEGAAAAEFRLAGLPIYRKALDPSLEYYSIGNDPIMSITDDWGPLDEEKNPLKLGQLPLSRLSSLNFLFGGAGDARHMFGSIIGLKKSRGALDDNRRSIFKAHITLLDIHPTPLARDLCLLLLLDDLLEGKHNETDGLEIQATLFYTYVGVIMPPYCYERFQNTVRRLLKGLQSNPPRLPGYIHVSTSSIPGIVESLIYWKKKLSGKTTRGILKHHSVEEAYRAMADMLSDPRFRSSFTNGVDPTAILKGCAAEISSQVFLESALYEQTRAFVPPTILLDRSHAALASAWGLVRTSDSRTKRERVRAAVKEAKEDIEETWKPNPSLLDSCFDRDHGYPDLNMDAFEAIRCIKNFNDRLGILGVDAKCPSFTIVNNFFSAVVDSLRALKGSLIIEIIQGDIFQELKKMRTAEDVSRPVRFPRQYTRMWLSNVPDYTHGPFNTAIHAVPALECTGDASVSSNCLLNAPFWQDADHFCHNYALLTVQELPRFLGCKVLKMKPLQNGKITLGPQQLPRPLQDLATREELTTWLTRLLVCTVMPPTPGNSGYRVRYPNNLVAFFNLLVHLSSVGYPSHWLSDFVSTILSGSLVTDIAPFLGELPIPMSEKTRRVASRKINLDPWLVEFETIIATSYEAIPFPMSLPVDFSDSNDEIGLFEIQLYWYMFSPRTMGLTSYEPVLGLLFYNGGVEHFDDTLTKRVNEILEGKLVMRRGDIHILTAVDTFDKNTGMVRWKMSRKRVRKMKGEGWYMTPYRFDEREAVAAVATPASRWTEVFA